MKIGFFDSGIGGVSVLAEALQRLPGQEYLFYADVDHVPYGEKSEEEIAHYAMENARFLLSEGSEAIVVACNTATAVAIKKLRADIPVPVIGMEPAVKPAVEGIGAAGGSRGGVPGQASPGAGADTEAGRRVLVAATPVTLREEKLKELINRVDRLHRVDLLALPGLVPLAERERFDGAEAHDYLAEAFAGIDPTLYSAFVMGCTHFIYFQPLFRKLLGEEIRLIDGNAGTVRRLASVLGLSEEPDTARSRAVGIDAGTQAGQVRWYLSGRRADDPAQIAYFGRLLERVKKIKKL